MADPVYCSSDDVLAVMGQLAINLRTDDLELGDVAAHMAKALDYSAGRIDFYCARYSQTILAGNRWVKGVAEMAAVKWLCLHRLNSTPASVDAEWEEMRAELQLIREGKAEVPRAAKTRRPITVTNTVVELNRFNNQNRVDKNRSTGVAKNYRRPTGNTPDER